MKHLLTPIFLLASLTASAEDYSLYYDLVSGAQNTLVSTVAQLQKIEFDLNGHNMTVYKTDGTSQTIDISNLSRLYFSTPEAVAVTDVNGDEPTSPVSIYDLAGRRLDAKAFSDLSRGIYIINGKKVQVK